MATPASGNLTALAALPALLLLREGGDRSAALHLRELGRLATASGPGGLTALHVFALAGAARAVPALLAAGAQVDAPLVAGCDDSEYAGLLRWLGGAALGSGSTGGASLKDALAWLVALQPGRTPLALAAVRGQLAAALALLDGGADPGALLHLGCQLPAGPATAGLLAGVAQRVARGALAPSPWVLRGLVLLAAGRGLHDECLELLDSTATAQPPGGALHPADTGTLLYWAAAAGHLPLLARALALGADPNGVAATGLPLAAVAVVHRQLGALLALLDAGARLERVLVEAAIDTLQPAVLEALLRHGPSPAVDTAGPAGRLVFGGAIKWTCPVMRLLESNASTAKVGSGPGPVQHVVRLAVPYSGWRTHEACEFSPPAPPLPLGVAGASLPFQHAQQQPAPPRAGRPGDGGDAGCCGLQAHHLPVSPAGSLGTCCLPCAPAVLRCHLPAASAGLIVVVPAARRERVILGAAPPAAPPTGEFNPLMEQPDGFDLEGVNRSGAQCCCRFGVPHATSLRWHWHQPRCSDTASYLPSSTVPAQATRSGAGPAGGCGWPFSRAAGAQQPTASTLPLSRRHSRLYCWWLREVLG